MFQSVFQNFTTRGENMAQVIEKVGGEYRNRTDIRGFAIRCVATPPTRRTVVPAKYSILNDTASRVGTFAPLTDVAVRIGMCKYERH